MTKIACFISPHGFGHATRVVAILEALTRLHPDLHAHLFTTVPEPLFALLDDWTYHREPVDIGVIQTSALTVDIPATCAGLAEFLPFPAARIDQLARRCAGCAFILCDIAPLGIAVGKTAGIPTVLVENFTWDWIYQPYCGRNPALEPHARYLDQLFRQADHRIQTEPLCRKASRDLRCGPIFRRLRLGRDEVRARLGVGDRKMVLITLGGMAEAPPNMALLAQHGDLLFVIAGQPSTRLVTANCLLLQRDTDLCHPDLIAAADLVLAKPGYSTIAECCQVGARMLLIERTGYPESTPLRRYVKKTLGGMSISAAHYRKGEWLPLARELLVREKAAPATENGADKVAALLAGLL